MHPIAPSSAKHPGTGNPARTNRPLAILVWTVLIALAIATARDASAMPPPARGNTRGLSPHVRELIRQNPGLFYPKKGFRDVIERQKVQRQQLVSNLVRSGRTRGEAEIESHSRITTTRYCPVLCGQYSNKVTPDWPVGDLVDELFSLDYGATNPFGHPGSMREHYRDMSYGSFDVQGGVFGWFPLPQSSLYYQGASGDNGLVTDAADGQTGSFIRHTLQAGDASVDFRIYDNDGPDNVPNSGDDDGYVDLVMFVHPNDGGECGSDEIWSHSFSYSGWGQHNGQPFITNDIGANGQPLKVDDYVIMPAISCSGGRIEIGVFSHEFGHALGLPDLYDRTALDPAGAVTTGGMGLYCLMAAGSYGGDYDHPQTPVQMCAWSKEELGFLSPKEIVCDETTALYTTERAPEAIKMWRGGDYSTNEWFLVENRQRVKWDQYLLDTGFMITHVDNNVTTQNDEACPGGGPCPAAHPLIMVVEADNQWEMQTAAPPVLGPWFGESEDFFDASGDSMWDDLTLPSSRDHSGLPTSVSVRNIGPSSEKMFATFSVAQSCQSTPLISVVSSRVSGGCDLDGFLDPGERVSLAVTLRNQPVGALANNVHATITSLSPAVSVIQGSASYGSLGRGAFGNPIVPFTVQASGAAACSTQATLEVTITADGGYSTTQSFNVPLAIDSLYVPYPSFLDDVEGTTDNGWHHYAYINEDDWSRNTNANHTLGAIPGHSWFTAAPSTGKDVSLEPPAFIPSAATVVSFWHKYDTEDNWDGCLLELSTDGGRTWIDVGDLTNVGYDDAVMVNPQSSISGRRSWNGLNASYPLFDQVTLSMAPWAGQACLLRFRMGTDLASTGVAVPGWNIDDFQVTTASVLRERCEATLLCSGTETTPPSFAGLESASDAYTPACDAVDLKWQGASDTSAPITYLIYASTSTPVPTTTPVASTTLLRHRLTGLAPNVPYYFVVRARDSQGNVDANTVERSATPTCEPDLVVREFTLDETAGCDGDDRPDGGEFLDLAVTLQNLGASNAQDVTVTLRSLSSRVIVQNGNAVWSDLATQHYEPGIAPFEIAIAYGTPCLTPVTLELEITAAGGYSVTRTIDLVLESDGANVCDATPDCAPVSATGPSVPRVSLLAQNQPNPMNERTLFRYQLAAADAGAVRLVVYDLAGRVVRTLVEGTRTAGFHQVAWDRSDDSGRRVANGLYFYRLEIGDRRLTKKLTMVR